MIVYILGFLGNELSCRCRRHIRDVSSIPGSGRSPGGGHGNPLQNFWLENPLDKGAWWVVVHGLAKNWTWLKRHRMQCIDAISHLPSHPAPPAHPCVYKPVLHVLCLSVSHSCPANTFIWAIFLDFTYTCSYMIFAFLFLTDFTLYATV